MAVHPKPQERVELARVARLATVTADGRPHVVPCCFALVDETLVTAIDAKPKSTLALRRLANIAANPEVSLLVDHYDEADWDALWWVRVDGVARAVSEGPEREWALDALAAKYPQYAERRPPGAVIVIAPTRWRAWP